MIKIAQNHPDILKNLLTAPIKFPFDTSPYRLALLEDDKHLEFWSLMKEISDPKSSFLQNDYFVSGKGTILLMSEQSPQKRSDSAFPINQDSRRIFYDGMVGYAIWHYLTENGIESAVYRFPTGTEINSAFGFPVLWKIIAEIPFGSKESDAEESLLTKENFIRIKF